ncbi:hypothetical protein LCGC14_0601640 [marine sediment metagenome]|uniref:Uncharacterized protein n=1 Tax=marine sediment metagenome TaxID=412755 RepID=A0A0F9RAI4_9ZZZZ|nr:MAG: hypothetical protein Lokiarch_20710 [Candidatus Lokiarchaeum sp. GC14_75]
MEEFGIWDTKADAIEEGDKLRDVSPSKIRADDNGYTSYIFNKIIFTNHNYSPSNDDFKLFREFLENKIHVYPSDGTIPCNVVASEAKEVLDIIVAYSNDSNNPYFESARTALKNGKLALLRGTVKLYLGKFTTREWRKKRFTNEINFWTFQVGLLDHILEQLGWIKNIETREWEKTLQWTTDFTDEMKFEAICTADNLNELLDFTSENYFEGTKLREIFNKKLRRGYDVDISDIINVALFHDNLIGNKIDEWNEAWGSFDSATNTRNSRITSNIISLCRYSMGIADQIDQVSISLNKHHRKILEKNEFPDKVIEKICKTSTQWLKYLKKHGLEATRNKISAFLFDQLNKQPHYVKNLRSFTKKVLELLNSKYEYLKIKFEVE